MKKYFFALTFLSLFITFSNQASALSDSEFRFYNVKLFLDDSKPYTIGDTIDCFVYYRATNNYRLFITSNHHNVIFVETENTNDAQDSMCIYETTSYWNPYERAVFFQILLKDNISDEITFDITRGKPYESYAFASISLNYDSLNSKFDIVSTETKDFLENGEEVNYEVRFHFLKPEKVKDNWQCEYMAYNKFPVLKKTGIESTHISNDNDSILVSNITIPKGLKLICRLINYDSLYSSYQISEIFPNTQNMGFDNLIQSAGYEIDKQTPYFYISNYLYYDWQFNKTKPCNPKVLIGKDENGNEINFIASTHSVQHRDNYNGFSYNCAIDKNIIKFNEGIKVIDNLVNADEKLGIFIIPTDTNYFPGFITKDGKLEMEYAIANGEIDRYATYASLLENSIYSFQELPDTIRFQFTQKKKNNCNYYIRGNVIQAIIDKIYPGEDFDWVTSFPGLTPTELPMLESHFLVTLRDTNFIIIDFTFTDNEGNFMFSNLCKGTYYLSPFEPFEYPVSVQKVVLDKNYNPNDKIELMQMSALGVQEKPNYIPFALSVYPNPAHKKLTLNFDENLVFDSYEIWDLSGNKIQTGLLINNEIPIEKLLKGAFLVVLRNDKFIISTKFVKE